MKQAIANLGGVYIGLDLPLTAQSQTVWNVVDEGPKTFWQKFLAIFTHGRFGDPSDPGSWGGHAVFCPDYDSFDVTGETVTCITWGGLMKMTKAFWMKYCSECHALASKAFLNSQGVSPLKVDITGLVQDARALAS